MKAPGRLKESKNGYGSNDSIFYREPFYTDKLFAKGQKLKQKGFPIKNKYIFRGVY